MPYLTVNSHKIHYFDSWDPNAQLIAPKLSILLIHGLGSTQNYYFPLLPSLNQHRCITLDNYGAGRSKYDGQEHSVATIAADVLSVMDALDIQKAVIVGHSMGGMVVTYLASTAPERVLGCVAIGPVHPNPGAAEIFEGRVRTVEKGAVASHALHGLDHLMIS
jgi:pimeloyl-ACP methyl ester carboxylesterase